MEDEPNLSNLGLHLMPPRRCGSSQERKEEDDEGRAEERKTVLILGDGDMSYSLSLALCLRARGVTCRQISTTFDDEKELRRKYSRFPAILEQLGVLGVETHFGIDARRIEEHAETLFGTADRELQRADRVVFNFPHFGGKSKVTVNRKLLGDFFVSARDFIEPGRGEIWVSLISGQGGTHAERFKRLVWANTWQVQDRAADAGLLMKDAAAAATGLETLAKHGGELGYLSRGWRDRDASFHLDGAITHMFAYPHAEHCPRQRYPLRWYFCLGFYIDPDNFSLDVFHDLIRKLKPGIMYETSLYSKYHEPETGRYGLTYHITFVSTTTPISKAGTHQLMLDLRAELDQLEAAYVARNNLKRLSREELGNLRQYNNN